MIDYKSQEDIIREALKDIPDNMDKRQGSLIYDAVAPFAGEVSQMYFNLQDTLKLGFVDTSVGEYLERLASQFGVDRIKATRAVGKAVFDKTIDIGTRFSIADSEINFVITKLLGTELWGDGDAEEVSVYAVECEQTGTAGNVTGVLIPIDAALSLGVSYLTEITYKAIDDELDEELRDRTLSFIRRPHLDGNVAQYIFWADNFPGIGECYVEKDTSKLNHVNIYISDEDGGIATTALIEDYQKFLDPNMNGDGSGQAPIGAVVKVSSLTAVALDIKAVIKMREASKLNIVIEQTRPLIEEYISKEANKEKEIKPYEIAKIIDDHELVDSVLYIVVNGEPAIVPLPIAPRESVVLNSFDVGVD